MGTEGDVLGKRILASIIDVLVLLALFVGGGITAVVLAESVAALGIVVFLGVLAIYFYVGYLMEGGFGRTPGKAAMGLVVVDEDGSRCTYGSSFLRNLLWIVDGIGFGPFVVALIVFVTDRNQRVGDMVASTVVVRAKR